MMEIIDSSFYSTTAQIIVVLMLALSLERRRFNDLSEKTLYGFVSRVHQLYLYIFSFVGLAIALLHLASFNFGIFDVGKVTILVCILAMLMLLISIFILSVQKTKLNKRGYAVITFIAVPLFLSTAIGYLEMFTDNFIDIIFVSILGTLIMIITFVVLFRNRSYMIEVKEIIGTGKPRKQSNDKK